MDSRLRGNDGWGCRERVFVPSHWGRNPPSLYLSPGGGEIFVFAYEWRMVCWLVGSVADECSLAVGGEVEAHVLFVAGYPDAEARDEVEDLEDDEGDDE